jgi:hypothetical protein
MQQKLSTALLGGGGSHLPRSDAVAQQRGLARKPSFIKCLLFAPATRAGEWFDLLRQNSQVPSSNVFAAPTRIAHSVDNPCVPIHQFGLGNVNVTRRSLGMSKFMNLLNRDRDETGSGRRFSEAEPRPTVLRSTYVLRGGVNRVSNQSIRSH